MNSDTIHISIVGHNVITRAYNNHMILTQSIDIPYIYSLQKVMFFIIFEWGHGDHKLLEEEG